MIINYELNSKHISSIFEQIIVKINKFVPGTDIKIIGDKYLKNKILNKPILNFSWHISKEIKYYLKKSGINKR